MELRQYKLVFRRYASLYFIAGLDINGDDVGLVASVNV